MTTVNREELIHHIRDHGPRRVVINEHGEAVTSGVAHHRHGIDYEIIFVRGDSWTLGAPKALDQLAYNMWAGDWVGVILPGDDGGFTRWLNVSDWLSGEGAVEF